MTNEMTVGDLYSKLRELVEEGKGNYLIGLPYASNPLIALTMNPDDCFTETEFMKYGVGQFDIRTHPMIKLKPYEK